jgi:hypothetical protein
MHIQERNGISLSSLLKGSHLTLNVYRVTEMQPEHENLQKLFPALLPSIGGGMEAGTRVH